jgi:hypothetical protein
MYLCDRHLHLGNRTTNRVESHNNKIKHILSANDKLHTAVKGLMLLHKLQVDKDQYTKSLLQSCSYYQYGTSNNILSTCNNILTPYAAKMVKAELHKSEDYNEKNITMTGKYTINNACTACSLQHIHK